jgi:hypothetical protein
MFSSLPGTALAYGSAPCRPQRPQCLVHRRPLSLHPLQICRVPQAAPHHGKLRMRQVTIQVSNDILWEPRLGPGSNRCWHAGVCYVYMFVRLPSGRLLYVGPVCGTGR